MTNPLRLGISPCPNDVFIFSGLILGRVDTGGLRFHVGYEDVETLNQRAQAGEPYDVVKISYANYARCAPAYDLLDGGGALGRGVGPLLLRNGEGAFDPEREILVPGASTTANFLLDYFAQPCPLPQQQRKRFLPFDRLYDELRRTPGAQGVVIHEKRFTFARDGLTLLQDLGEHWEAATGFAIPLGAIVARRALALNKTLEHLIRQSLTWAEAHRTDALALCREHAQDLSDEVMTAHIALYVNDYSRDLGEDGRAAVAYFLEQQKVLVRPEGDTR